MGHLGLALQSCQSRDVRLQLLLDEDPPVLRLWVAVDVGDDHLVERERQRTHAMVFRTWHCLFTALVCVQAVRGRGALRTDLPFDLTGAGRPFHKPWEAAVGSGHAKLALRLDWQQTLLDVKQHIDFKRVRFHGLLDDDMGLVASVDSAAAGGRHGRSEKYTLNFTNIQTVFDFLVHKANVAPYVELSFMPGLLASGKTTYLHYKARTDPPKNYSEWGEVMSSLATFLIDRYGIEEVSTWYFEVWNEPNLKNPLPRLVGEFWTGTQGEYYELFATTSRALKAISPRLAVGGPVTSGAPAWIDDFLRYCRVHDVAVDFVSAHSYPSSTDASYLVNAVQSSMELAQVAGKSFFLSEFNSGLWFGCCHDRGYAAAFLVHTALCLQSLPSANLAGMSYWTFSDIFEELFMDRDPFHNGYGLVTVNGIKKPAFRAFELLGQFPSEFYGSSASGATRNVSGFTGIRAHNETNIRIATLLTRFMPSIKGHGAEPGINVTVEYTLSHGAASGGRCTVRVGYIDHEHTNPYEVWRSLGSPNPMSKEAEALVRNASTLRMDPLPCQKVELGETVRVRTSLVLVTNGVAFLDVSLAN